MNVLGIDFGKAHVGLALGSTETGLAEPLKTELTPMEYQKIENICIENGVEKIIIGMSEGESARETREFAGKLEYIGIPIIFYDETLTTQDALRNLLHLSAKKREKTEHAAAAAIVLQDWLADNV